LSDDYGVILHLSYGCELFVQLGINAVWQEIVAYLNDWKNSIPDLPEINFDEDAQSSFREIQDVEPAIYRKLFSNPDLDDFLSVLSPEQATLHLLNEHFQLKYKNGKGKIYQTLSELCTQAIHRVANHSGGRLTPPASV